MVLCSQGEGRGMIIRVSILFLTLPLTMTPVESMQETSLWLRHADMQMAWFNMADLPVAYETLDANSNSSKAMKPAEIVTKILDKVKEILKNGDVQHGLPAVDPQQFNLTHHTEDENVWMSISVESQLANVSNLFWESVFTCPLTMQVQAVLVLKDVVMNGTYNLTGMAYEVFPIFGDGDFQMTIEQMKLIVTTEVSPRQGDHPLQLDNLNIHLHEFQGFKMNFENLMGDEGVSSWLSHLAADISEKVAYRVASEFELVSSTTLYEKVADLIKKITLLDIVRSINNL